MSREALALDISRVVSRVVSGEPIDTAERGAALAAKYPELGMSGEMIGQAIVRAAGMVGLIRTAPAPGVLPRAPLQTISTEEPQQTVRVEHDHPSAITSPPLPKAAAPSPSALNFDDELAAAIDAEIGVLVSGTRQAARAAPTTANGGDDGNAPDEEQSSAEEQSVADQPAFSKEEGISEEPVLSDEQPFADEEPFSEMQTFTEEQAFSDEEGPDVPDEQPLQQPHGRRAKMRKKGPIAALRRVFFRN